MRQGDNLARVLLILVMQLAVEEIKTALKENNVELINFKHDEVNGKMRLHCAKGVESTIMEEINLLARVCNGSLMLKDISDML